MMKLNETTVVVVVVVLLVFLAAVVCWWRPTGQAPGSSGVQAHPLNTKQPPHTDTVAYEYICRGARALAAWTYDQEDCGSCWVAAPLAVMAGRWELGDPFDVHSTLAEMGVGSALLCKGGYVVDTFEHGEKNGFVVCSTCPNTIKATGATADLAAHSRQSGEGYRYRNGPMYTVRPGEAAIVQELNTNGPVTAEFELHEDLFDFSFSPNFDKAVAVYSKTPGSKRVERHCVAIVGYGITTAGYSYWLIKNSWGVKGFTRIRRGVDECGLETTKLCAALPVR